MSNAPPVLVALKLPLATTLVNARPPALSVIVTSLPLTLTLPPKLLLAWANMMSSPAESVVAPDTAKGPD